MLSHENPELIQALLAISTNRVCITENGLSAGINGFGVGDISPKLLETLQSQTGVVRAMALQAICNWQDKYPPALQILIDSGIIEALISIFLETVGKDGCSHNPYCTSLVMKAMRFYLSRAPEVTMREIQNCLAVERLISMLQQTDALSTRILCMGLYLLSNVTNNNIPLIQIAIDNGGIQLIESVLRCVCTHFSYLIKICILCRYETDLVIQFKLQLRRKS